MRLAHGCAGTRAFLLVSARQLFEELLRKLARLGLRDYLIQVLVEVPVPELVRRVDQGAALAVRNLVFELLGIESRDVVTGRRTQRAQQDLLVLLDVGERFANRLDRLQELRSRPEQQVGDR